MKVELKNINKIRNASVELNSLTVIAGANDSGKSTVGKVLFSTIKALISGLNDSEEQKNDTIRERAASLRKRLNSFRLKGVHQQEQRNFFPLDFGFGIRKTTNVTQFFAEREQWINTLDIVPRQKMLSLKDLNVIKSLFMNKSDYSTRVKTEFQSYIESEFLNNICSNNTNDSFIEYTFDYSSINLNIQNNDVTNVTCKKLSDTILEDITYVESPLYIHLLDVLLGTTTYREIEKTPKPSLFAFPMVAAHIKDIATKLGYSSKYMHLKKQNKSIFNIKTITGGAFVYDKETQSLVWKKDNVSFSPVNVASGIKSFGVIQLLLAADIINENKMLIWDEPENHLHPKWQIEFAHLLVNLAKAGIPVVVSSHSPYFIQGIRYFSRKEQIDKYVNYYLAEETEDGLADINEVTNDLNRVFTKLAEPLNEIMNLE